MRVTAGGFAGQVVLETPATPAVIHIHKLDRLENAVSPGQVVGAIGGRFGPPVLTRTNDLTRLKSPKTIHPSEVHRSEGGLGPNRNRRCLALRTGGPKRPPVPPAIPHPTAGISVDSATPPPPRCGNHWDMPVAGRLFPTACLSPNRPRRCLALRTGGPKRPPVAPATPHPTARTSVDSATPP